MGCSYMMCQGIHIQLHIFWHDCTKSCGKMVCKDNNIERSYQSMRKDCFRIILTWVLIMGSIQYQCYHRYFWYLIPLQSWAWLRRRCGHLLPPNSCASHTIGPLNQQMITLSSKIAQHWAPKKHCRVDHSIQQVLRCIMQLVLFRYDHFLTIFFLIYMEILMFMMFLNQKKT